MALTDRFQAALQSQVGVILLGLLGFLAALFVIYLVLAFFQKRRDILARHYRKHYEKAEALAEGFQFVGVHKADFFGRHTIVLQKEKEYAVCLIPPPKVCDETKRERITLYQEATQHQRLPILAPQTIKVDQGVIILLQRKILKKDGRYLPSLRQMAMDGRLGISDVEFILLELARGLAALHDLRASNGEALFHGMVLPRSVYLMQEANKTVTEVVLADCGLPFALGGLGCSQRLKQLADGKLIIDRFAARAFLKEVPLIAPELRDPQRSEQVGPPADFFSFAALAVTLFTKQTFAGPTLIDWSQIPQRWHSFLKPCLRENPEKRPKDFLELQDWLTDPELALTHLEAAESDASQTTSKEEATDGEEKLGDLLNKIQAAKSGTLGIEEKTIHKAVVKAQRLMRNSKWEGARAVLETARSESPEDPEILVHLAIACHELGEREQSESHYRKAKEKNPAVAKKFREHIAFKV